MQKLVASIIGAGVCVALVAGCGASTIDGFKPTATPDANASKYLQTSASAFLHSNPHFPWLTSSQGNVIVKLYHENLILKPVSVDWTRNSQGDYATVWSFNVSEQPTNSGPSGPNAMQLPVELQSLLAMPMESLINRAPDNANIITQVDNGAIGIKLLSKSGDDLSALSEGTSPAYWYFDKTYIGQGATPNTNYIQQWLSEV